MVKKNTQINAQDYEKHVERSRGRLVFRPDILNPPMQLFPNWWVDFYSYYSLITLKGENRKLEAGSNYRLE